MGINEKFLKDLQRWSLNYANCILENKSCKDRLEIHSIALIGGGARCYFDENDIIEKHKDLDIDIYFAPIDNIDGKLRMRINTQGRPKVESYNGIRIDIARTVLLKPKSKSIVEDIREYAEEHKTKRWCGRRGNPIIFIYPEIKPIISF